MPRGPQGKNEAFLEEAGLPGPARVGAGDPYSLTQLGKIWICGARSVHRCPGKPHRSCSPWPFWPEGYREDCRREEFHLMPGSSL